MDDAVKGLTIGVLTILALHGPLNRRARHAAERQLRESLGNSGEIHAVVREQAPFGIYANDIRAIDVFTDHVITENLPFTQVPRGGWKGTIHHVRLHLMNTIFAGMPISRLEADIPHVTYDLGHALYKDRLLIRSAGMGPVSVWLSEANIAAIAQTRLGKTLSNLSASITGDRLTLSGEISFISRPTPFLLDALVSPRADRYLELTDAVITLNGKQVDASMAQSLLERFNPILDVDKDLHLGGVLTIHQVAARDRALVIEGSMGIPMAATQTQHQ